MKLTKCTYLATAYGSPKGLFNGGGLIEEKGLTDNLREDFAKCPMLN